MKQSVFNKVYCSSAYCKYGMDDLPPVMLGMTEQEINHQMRDLGKIPLSAALQDVDGNYWCPMPACKLRHDFINWGKAHNWPSITCPPFALAEGHEVWTLAIRLGRDDYIQAIADAIAAMEAS